MTLQEKREFEKPLKYRCFITIFFSISSSTSQIKFLNGLWTASGPKSNQAWYSLFIYLHSLSEKSGLLWCTQSWSVRRNWGRKLGKRLFTSKTIKCWDFLVLAKWNCKNTSHHCWVSIIVRLSGCWNLYVSVSVSGGVMKSCSYKSFCSQANSQGYRAPGVRVHCCYSNDCNVSNSASSLLPGPSSPLLLLVLLLAAASPHCVFK